MRLLRFTVLGRPQPAGSKRAIQNPHTGRIAVVDDAKRSRPWKQEVASAAHRAVVAANTGDLALLDGPIILELAFFVARPKGHYRTGRNAHLLRDAAPAWPTTRPDTTKLIRAVEDAMTGQVWRDDAQVVRQYAVKCYGVPERVEVLVRTLPATCSEDKAAHEFELPEEAMCPRL